jgi:predicted alpha/beta superfamily hydrolase
MLEFFKVHMTPFDHDRIIRVYLPLSYEHSTQTYPVLYMHDGQNVFDDSEAIGGISLGLLDFLDTESLDVIVVAIDQSHDRMNEYTPWEIGDYSLKNFGPVNAKGGKGEQYVDYIVNELKPLIDQKYRTKQDQTAMAGISLGGLISLYAACRFPTLFSNVVTLSSAFFRNQEGIEALIKASDLSSIQSIYMDCGSVELASDPVICRHFVEANRRIFDLVKTKVPCTQFHVVERGHHDYGDFKKRLPALFTFLEK